MGRMLSFNCVKESVNPNHTNAAFVLGDAATACLLLLRYTITVFKTDQLVKLGGNAHYQMTDSCNMHPFLQVILFFSDSDITQNDTLILT